MALAMALVAGPAGATTGTHGDASGTGEEEYINLGQDYGTATQPFCFEVTSAKYRVDMNGEFYAQDGSEQAGYIGPATLYWETSQAMDSYYIAPEGIYAGLHENPVTGETECDPDTLGDPVEARVWVERVETDNGYIEDCEEPKGNVYSRVSNLIEVDWAGECEVQSNDAMVPPYDKGPVRADADHLFEGTLDARPAPWRVTGATGNSEHDAADPFGSRGVPLRPSGLSRSPKHRPGRPFLWLCREALEPSRQVVARQFR